MEKEFKLIDMSQLKFLDEDGPGGFEGYASNFGELDDGADIALPGAYKETLERFLHQGFTAHSHDWSYDGVIGYPVDAREDDRGLYIKSQFHSTPDAQMVRTKARERMEAGKAVKLSIGYEAKQVSYINAKDYAEQLPKFLQPDKVDAGIEKAKRFPRVRLLHKMNLFEHSIVTVPMLNSAQVLSVKEAPQPEPEPEPEPTPAPTPEPTPTPEIQVKGMFEDELASKVPTPWDLWQCFCCVLMQLLQLDEASENSGVAIDIVALMDEALAEYMTRLRTSVMNMLGEEGEGEAGEVAFTARRLDAAPLAEQAEFLSSVSRALVDRFKAYHELVRVKEGRTISTANATRMNDSMTRIKDTITSMEAVHSDLSELVKLAEPKPKSVSQEEVMRELARFELLRLTVPVN